MATVITPLPTVLDAPGSAPLSGAWRGVIGGSVLGLVIVGAVVIGARLQWSHAAASTASPARVVDTPPTPTAVTGPNAPVPAAELRAQAPASTGAPAVAVTSLPPAPVPVRWNPPVA
ncbi:MAG: hypothetical protein ACRELB_02705, partial [Polyangiaceae bacterium]